MGRRQADSEVDGMYRVGRMRLCFWRNATRKTGNEVADEVGCARLCWFYEVCGV